MNKFFNPKSIAVIGVSREPQKIGYLIFDNLLSCGQVELFGVNPAAPEILGQKTFKNILDIKNPVDLAIIVVPSKFVPHVLEGCGKKGVKNAIIISAGFSESGQSGKLAEAEILKIAQKHKVRILGPNCLGIINNFKNLNASFATAKLPAKHKVGIFSQSGAMGSAILDFANERNFGFSYFVSLGNKLDISENEIIESWIEDDNVSVAVGYLEDIKDGQKFIEIAKRFTAQKPLILLKGGTTSEGTRAASLHTAAMAQDDEVFEAVCRECGIIVAQNIGDLFELAIDFSVNQPPKGKKLVIISNAGGPAVLSADAAAKEKINLPSLNAHTIHGLASKTRAASTDNPIDLRGDASAADFGQAINLVLSDSATDGILVIVTPQAMTEIEEIAWQIVGAREKSKKPIYVCFIGGELVKRAREICAENGLSSFSYPERAVRAFRFQTDYRQTVLAENSKAKKHKNHRAAKSIINFSDRGLTPQRLMSVLRLYGITMANEVIVNSDQDAALALDKIPAPVVMKILSPDILHKTDVGGVVLGVKSPEEARESYQKILKNVKKHAPGAKIQGVTVMETAKEGLELIVGLKRDPIFGPVLMFGAGGIFVELIGDYQLAIGPFDETKIKEMISRTKVSRIIKGYRKNNRYNEKKLIDLILNLTDLFCEHREIQSIEINPVVLSDDGSGAIGLDAKVEMF